MNSAALFPPKPHFRSGRDFPPTAARLSRAEVMPHLEANPVPMHTLGGTMKRIASGWPTRKSRLSGCGKLPSPIVTPDFEVRQPLKARSGAVYFVCGYDPVAVGQAVRN